MIQRKQTIYLLLALALTIICLCLPLGTFTSNEDIGQTTTLYNLWTMGADGERSFSVWGLFVVLLVTCPICLIAIFSYHNRITQSRYCLFNILLIIGWYIGYAALALSLSESYGSYSISFPSIIPVISIILYAMARKAILADEALVRAADRIR